MLKALSFIQINGLYSDTLCAARQGTIDDFGSNKIKKLKETPKTTACA